MSAVQPDVVDISKTPAAVLVGGTPGVKLVT